MATIERPALWKRLGWLAAIWLAGVGAVGVVSYLIGLVLRP